MYIYIYLKKQKTIQYIRPKQCNHPTSPFQFWSDNMSLSRHHGYGERCPTNELF